MGCLGFAYFYKIIDLNYVLVFHEIYPSYALTFQNLKYNHTQ